jgi:transmembrane sensor
VTELPPAPDFLEEAARWRIQLHELGIASTPEFAAWRRSSPDREAAWARVEGPWRGLGQQAAEPELIAARGAALERARRAGRARWRDRRTISAPRALIAAGAAAVLVVVLGMLYWNRPATYRTDIAERRVLTLEDGSTLALDSKSEVRVRYTNDTRTVTLVRGQGRFNVAHDVLRPFLVEAGDQRVIATGTSFDVDLTDSKVSVTLIEGHVIVETRSDLPGQGVKLEPGERLVAAQHARPSVQHVDLGKATAWQEGYLVFEDETLASAVLRVNRYASHPVVIRDPTAATLRFSGVFKEGETAAFVDSVTRYLPLEEQTLPDGSVELKRRE